MLSSLVWKSLSRVCALRSSTSTLSLRLSLRMNSICFSKSKNLLFTTAYSDSNFSIFILNSSFSLFKRFIFYKYNISRSSLCLLRTSICSLSSRITLFSFWFYSLSRCKSLDIGMLSSFQAETGAEARRNAGSLGLVGEMLWIDFLVAEPKFMSSSNFYVVSS